MFNILKEIFLILKIFGENKKLKNDHADLEKIENFGK